MEFLVSKKEISRRKRAFTMLFIFFFIGLFVADFVFSYEISLSVVYLFIVVFSALAFATFVFLSSLSRNKLFIDDKMIKLENAKIFSSTTFEEISRIKIKRRRNGEIREIYIWTKKGRPIFISAFEDDFKNIKKILHVSITNNIPIKETREPLDFDHFLFYPIFGICTGLITLIVLNAMLNSSIKAGRAFTLSSSFFEFFLGIYFILKKPLFSRGTKKYASIDYITGGALIIFSILISLFF